MRSRGRQTPARDLVLCRGRDPELCQNLKLHHSMTASEYLERPTLYSKCGASSQAGPLQQPSCPPHAGFLSLKREKQTSVIINRADSLLAPSSRDGILCSVLCGSGFPPRCLNRAAHHPPGRTPPLGWPLTLCSAGTVGAAHTLGKNGFSCLR